LSRAIVFVDGESSGAGTTGAVPTGDRRGGGAGMRAQRADACRNRDRLLEVAGEVFAADGVEASLEKIARTAGVGIGTLYRHYPTRDALIEAVYRHNVELLCDSADELAASLPADQALAEWMQRFVTYVASKKGLAAYLKSVVAADSDLFVSSHAKVANTMAQLVDAAAATGSIRDGVNGMDLLHALGGVCLMSDQPGGSEQGAKVARLLMDGLRYGAAEPRSAAV
jgi:AcrR family transcriptional regulator